MKLICIFYIEENYSKYDEVNLEFD